MMKFKLNLFALLLLFTFNSLPAQKTLNIKEKAVVIVMPSNDRINQLKKESASDDEFSVIVEDGLYYLDQAKIFLKKKNIKTIKINSSDQVRFLENGRFKKFNIKELSWDIIFYMPKKSAKQIDITDIENEFQNYLKPVKWRCIGPFRGGRSVAACGVIGDPKVYYMGTTGGGLWKSTDMAMSWDNVSDGFFTRSRDSTRL